MTTTPEGKVKKRIKEILKARNIWFFMPQNMGMGSSGVPDFICCLPEFNGKMLAIEAKAAGKRNGTTALQDIQIAAIRTAKGWAIVIDDPDQLEEFLDVSCSALKDHHSQG